MYGERVGFVIVRPDAESGATLISCVIPVEVLLRNPWMKVHYNYYITKKLFPALGRVFGLIPLRLRWHTSTMFACKRYGLYLACMFQATNCV